MNTTEHLLRVALIIGGVILLVPLLMMTFMIPVMGAGHMGTWNGMTGPVWGWMVMGLFWLLLIVAIVYLIYRAADGGDRSARQDPAIQELRQAYARGDLTDEEFENRRERLEGSR